MADLSGPDRLEERLGEADFVIVTTPETPDTLGMFNARLFSRMKRGAYFINIARGPLCRHPRPDCSPAVRPARGRRARCCRPGAVAGRQPAMGNAERADHAACRDPRHPLSPEMGSASPRKLPALRRGSDVDQRRRQGKMVLIAGAFDLTAETLFRKCTWPGIVVGSFSQMAKSVFSFFGTATFCSFT